MKGGGKGGQWGPDAEEGQDGCWHLTPLGEELGPTPREQQEGRPQSPGWVSKWICSDSSTLSEGQSVLSACPWVSKASLGSEVSLVRQMVVRCQALLLIAVCSMLSRSFPATLWDWTTQVAHTGQGLSESLSRCVSSCLHVINMCSVCVWGCTTSIVKSTCWMSKVMSLRPHT